jgi:hypothetical protein
MSDSRPEVPAEHSGRAIRSWEKIVDALALDT